MNLPPPSPGPTWAVLSQHPSEDEDMDNDFEDELEPVRKRKPSNASSAAKPLKAPRLHETSSPSFSRFTGAGASTSSARAYGKISKQLPATQPNFTRSRTPDFSSRLISGTQGRPKPKPLSYKTSAQSQSTRTQANSEIPHRDLVTRKVISPIAPRPRKLPSLTQPSTSSRVVPPPRPLFAPNNKGKERQRSPSGSPSDFPDPGDLLNDYEWRNSQNSVVSRNSATPDPATLQSNKGKRVRPPRLKKTTTQEKASRNRRKTIGSIADLGVVDVSSDSDAPTKRTAPPSVRSPPAVISLVSDSDDDAPPKPPPPTLRTKQKSRPRPVARQSLPAAPWREREDGVIELDLSDEDEAQRPPPLSSSKAPSLASSHASESFSGTAHHNSIPPTSTSPPPLPDEIPYDDAGPSVDVLAVSMEVVPGSENDAQIGLLRAVNEVSDSVAMDLHISPGPSGPVPSGTATKGPSCEGKVVDENIIEELDSLEVTGVDTTRSSDLPGISCPLSGHQKSPSTSSDHAEDGQVAVRSEYSQNEATVSSVAPASRPASRGHRPKVRGSFLGGSDGLFKSAYLSAQAAKAERSIARTASSRSTSSRHSGSPDKRSMPLSAPPTPPAASIGTKRELPRNTLTLGDALHIVQENMHQNAPPPVVKQIDPIDLTADTSSESDNDDEEDDEIPEAALEFFKEFIAASPHKVLSPTIAPLDSHGDAIFNDVHLSDRSLLQTDVLANSSEGEDDDQVDLMLTYPDNSDPEKNTQNVSPIRNRSSRFVRLRKTGKSTGPLFVETFNVPQDKPCAPRNAVKQYVKKTSAKNSTSDDDTLCGVPLLTWERVRKARRFKPPYFLSQDMPRGIHDTVNSLPEEYRKGDMVRDIFEAAMRENTAADEPDAPSIEVYNEIDDEPCPPFEFYYTNHLWHTDGVPPPTVDNLRSCNCRGRCDPRSKTCACRNVMANFEWSNGFLYDEYGRLKSGTDGYPIFECNEYCGCGDECTNRVVQHGRKCKVNIVKTKNKGWGIFAGETRIPRGSFVGVYSGEIMTDMVAEERGLVYNKTGLSYLFDIDFYHLKEEEDWAPHFAVDAYHAGNFTRFLNHSCDPNCSIHACYVNEANIEKPLLVLFTDREILPYEELCFSYLGVIDENEKTDNSIKTDAVYACCCCGASNCKGIMWK